MRVQARYFPSYSDCDALRIDFPYCGNCGGPLKIQQSSAGYYLECIKHPAHRSIRDKPLQETPHATG